MLNEIKEILAKDEEAMKPFRDIFNADFHILSATSKSMRKAYELRNSNLRYFGFAVIQASSYIVVNLKLLCPFLLVPF